MQDTITVWPNGNWCENDDIEHYMRELGLGDDCARVPRTDAARLALDGLTVEDVSSG